MEIVAFHQHDEDHLALRGLLNLPVVGIPILAHPPQVGRFQQVCLQGLEDPSVGNMCAV